MFRGKRQRTEHEIVWFVTTHQLPTWLKEEDGGGYLRPYVVFIIDMSDGAMVASEVQPGSPDAAAVRQVVRQALTRPIPFGEQAPPRPSVIAVDDEALAAQLKPLLAEDGLATRFQERPDLATYIAGSLDRFIEKGPDIPGLLQTQNVKPQHAAGLYEAAATFYRAEPWERLADEDVFAIEMPPGKQPLLAVVMGALGEQYGLAVYRDWDEIALTLTDIDPMDRIPAKGLQAMLFEEAPDVPFADIEDAERYGWELPAPDVYPMPVIYKQRSVQRPNPTMLRWYEAVMRAIPVFLDRHLKEDDDGLFAPVEADIRVPTGAGEKTVRIRYPAGDIEGVLRSIAGLPAEEAALLDAEESLEDEDELEFEDWGEADLDDEADLDGTGDDLSEDEDDDDNDPDREEALWLIGRAQSNPRPRRRMALARKAMAVCPHCVEPYMFLADDAGTMEEELRWLEEGAKVGRTLLADFIASPALAPLVSSLADGQPLLELLPRLALALSIAGRNDEAEATLHEALKLDPDDSYGARYILLHHLTAHGRDEEAQELLDRYSEMEDTQTIYTQALVAFRRFGRSPAALTALRKALDHNPHVPAYLTSEKPLPEEPYGLTSPGSDEEAANYAWGWGEVWQETPGALKWLQRTADAGS